MIAAVGGLEDKVGRKSRGILEIRRKKKKKTQKWKVGEKRSQQLENWPGRSDIHRDRNHREKSLEEG